MKIKVQFFEESLVDAVGAGVYEIYSKADDKEALFYVPLKFKTEYTGH